MLYSGQKRFSFEASFAKRCDALVSDNLYNLLSLLNSYFNRRLMKDMRTFIVKTSMGLVIYGIMPPGFNYSGYTESIFKYRYGIYSSREIVLPDSTINFIIREADSCGITAITFTVSSEDEFSVKKGNFISRFFRNSSKTVGDAKKILLALGFSEKQIAKALRSFIGDKVWSFGSDVVNFIG